MFDEEINLNPSGPTSKATQSPSGNATGTAKALLRNQKFYCARIKAEVSPLNCKGKYTYAKAQGITASPCLECAKVQMMLRKVPLANCPEPQPTIDPKELAAMSRSAKKGTPDPIQQEAKAANVVAPKPEAAAKVLEIVEKKAAQQNPFAGDGWTKYDPMASRRAVALEFAAISRTSISFSAGVTERLKLKEFPTMTLYHGADGKRIGVELRKDSSGVLKCTVESKGRAGVKVAAQGLIKALEMDPTQFKGKRFAVREIAPGFVEVDLKSEVAA